MTIANKIRTLRNNHNISAKKLGEQISLSQQYISDIENNKSNPSIETLEKIVSYFGLTLAEFFMDETDPIVLPEHFKEFFKENKGLTPEQLKQLTEFLKTLK